MLHRNTTTDLLELLSYFPVTGIIGPRQVGKTTIAITLSNKIKKEAIYLDLENPQDAAKLSDPVLFFKQNEDKCVILDEIQRQPQLFPILRSMVDQHRVPARFILLGSASPDLIRDTSESLAGRIAYQELYPFNLTEVSTEQYDDVLKHWFRGGFPDSFLAPSDGLVSKWQTNFIQTYVERDLPLLGLDINRNVIRKIWTMSAHIHGNVLNMSNIGRALELTSTTIKKYLAFLEGAFLIRQLQPYSVNIKKRLVKSPKIYIRDSGVLHKLLAINSISELLTNPMVGNSWEGYAIEQIVQNIDDDTSAYFYRTHEGTECDLVLVKSGKPTFGVEIKYTSSPKVTKGLLQAYEDLNTSKNYIITPNTDEYEIKEGIIVCNLVTFLKDHLR